MKQKVVLVGTAAREKLLKGANFGADAVKSTLGPYGQNAVSGLQGQIKITNDGKTIAHEIQLEDEIENLGWRVLKEAALKVDEEVGDGTTTAITLAQSTLTEGNKYLKKEGSFVGKMSAVALSKKIGEETKEVIEKLALMATPVTTRDQLIEVARVSVEDVTLAELIGGTQWDLGKDGTIVPEESNNTTDSVEPIRGVRIDNGFGTSLILNNLAKGTFEVKNTRIILTNYEINGENPLKPLQKVLTELAEAGIQEVVIVARAFSPLAIQQCMESYKSGFHISPMNAPYTDQGQVMRDLEAVTGARYIDQEQSTLESLELKDAGFAEHITASHFSAVITGKRNDQVLEARIATRIEELEKSLQASESPFEKRNISARLSQLKNGFALLKVGANSVAERKYKFDKVQDAVNATKLSLQEGTVPGGGQALKTISEDLPDDYILKPVLLAPYKQIMKNAGGTIEIPEWVRDPVKVVKVALIKATSVAAQLSTVEIGIEWKNVKPKEEEE